MSEKAPAPQAPKIPKPLLQAAFDDRLLLFCGSGISAVNGLPLFGGLAKQLLKELLPSSAQNDPKLKALISKDENFRILVFIEDKVGPKKTRQAVMRDLSRTTGEPFFHKTLLELSQISTTDGQEVRYLLVTTNVDELFFKAGLSLPMDELDPEATWGRTCYIPGFGLLTWGH